MRTTIHATMRSAVSLGLGLLAATGIAYGQTTTPNPTIVNLSAVRATAVLPDGSAVPMWAYCGAAATGSGGSTVGGACPATTPGVWSPGPTITVPAGGALTIQLANSLPVATSLTIVGQFGGTDLGAPNRVASPTHNPQLQNTWNANTPNTFTPPPQGLRARSFGPEAVVGGSQTYTWAAGVLRPGTYLYETGTHPSLQVPMGLYGVLIVTQAPVAGTAAGSTATPGQAYPSTTVPPGSNGYNVANAGAPYDADVTYLLSEIDAAQNTAVDAAAQAKTAEDLVSTDPSCVQAQKGGTVACYPAAVNYRPTYFLINGSPFNAANPAATTAVIADTAAATGNVLVRFANAGLRTHVPVFNNLQMALLSEDGNLQPGLPKVQSEINLPPGRTADALLTLASNGTPATAGTVALPTSYTDSAYALFDRALALAGNNQANAGMHGYLLVAAPGTGATPALVNSALGTVNGGVATVTPSAANYTFSLAPNVLPAFSASVATNSVGLISIVTGTAPKNGSVVWSAGGTFTYTPNAAPIALGDTFTYCNSVAGVATATCGTVTLQLAAEAATIAGPAKGAVAFNGNMSSLYVALTRSAGVLAGFSATDGFPLTAALTGKPAGCAVQLAADGSFSAASSTPAASGTCTFTFSVTDSRNPATAISGSATVNFPAPSGLQVTVADALNGSTGAVPAVTDYMWIVEEDPTYFSPNPGTVLPWSSTVAPPVTLATGFHYSHSTVVAVGCTGPISCGDGAGGQKVQGVAVANATYTSPADVALDPTKHYFISVLPGDAANPFVNAFAGDPLLTNSCLVGKSNATSAMATDCGHSIGGAQIAPKQAAVTVKVEPNPLRPAALSIYIFEDNSPTNNDYDANEVGLGGFEIIVNDVAGRSGDPVGQITFDAYNMPLTNSLLGVAGCPNETPAGASALQQTNLVGVVYTCPDGDRQISGVSIGASLVTITTAVPHQFGSSVQGANPTIDISGLDIVALNGSFPVNVTGPNTFTFPTPAGVAVGSLKPRGISMARDATTYQLAGQALINNIMPGRYDVLAHPGAAREGRGETWYQVSTLEGTPGQDAFTKSNEPNYFQEFGPPGFHTFIGWINPGHLDDQNKMAVAQANAAVGGIAPTTVISGTVTSLHMSRTIMETLWDSASNAAIAQSTCFVAVNQTGETGNDIAFTSCNPDGSFTLPPIPAGQQYELVIWDQWLDQIIAFKNLSANQVVPGKLALGNIPVFSWFTRVEASVYLDTNGNGVRDPGEPGVALVPVKIHFRDGSISNVLTTDGNGVAVFNELFPLFNWYVITSDQARFAPTGVNVVVDGGGLPDCVDYNVATGQGKINMGNARCPTSTTTITGTSDTAAPLGGRTGGVANSQYVWTDPTTGLAYGAVPTGASTSTSRVDAGTNLFNGMFEGLQSFINQTEMIDWGRRDYKVGENGGISGMVVYASTRGFDDPSLEVQFMWEPGVPRVQINLYREQTNADGTTGYIYVNSTTSTSWDDWANLVHGSDGKSYILGLDGILRDPVTHVPAPSGVTAGTQVNMTCPGQDTKDPFLPYSLGAGNQFRCYDGFHMWNQVQPAVFDGAYLITADAAGNPLKPGRYVVEMVPPPGYEIVKEEDKNILIGDQWVAPPAQQFGGLSNIFVLPDQASLSSAYNPNNPNNNNTTQSLGFVGAKLLFPKCVGQLHQVPDFMSLFPTSGQVAPFAGAMKNLCDRKEVVLNDQMMASANFFVFTRTPRASHFTGLILDDAAAEINNAAPDFGEKFAASFAPVSLKDFNGVEIERVYSDQWGTYNGMAPSTWQVNVPNPAGYSPNMMVNCMNDPGPILDTNPSSPTYGQQIVDPLYNPSYSNFCYTNPFMPGMTVYLDTPILPVAAFAAGYNPPDCALPATTPAIKRVDGASTGPWVPATGGTITIQAQGDVQVPNPNYQGPKATTAPFNTRTIARHYGFGTTAGTVSINGKPLPVANWGDAQITATVPAGTPSGELSIVTAAGVKSVDTVTVTVEGTTAPVVVKPASGAALTTGTAHPIQDAIDAATPGDLIIVDAGNYPELVVMWKPVRLQGVGAASTIINAAKYPTQKLQAWRPVINRLFGVDTVLGNQVANSQVDPLPNQEITGGIVLLEPSVLATEEGAGITVLAKNPASVDANGNPNANCGNTANSSYPDQVLFPPTSTTVNIVPASTRMSDSNFTCAPSRIDGLSVTGSDAGGGIYVNGWAHGLEIANNRVYGNAGSFNGGVRVGIPYLEGVTATPVAPDGTVFGFDVGVHIHHNQITNNGTVEANPGAVNAANSTGVGGGLSICTGTDNYVVNYNFICGNYSAGDGGGIGQTGVSNNGLIAQNTIVFNQSYQQTAQVNGGGIVIEGEPGAIGGLSLGTGSVTIDGNLIRGNFAEGGHGGGIRLQQVNGSDVSANPNNGVGANLQPWYSVTISNNMIDNNVSGWAGAGISAADALDVRVWNNTIANNDSVGIVGSMIGTNPLGRAAPLTNTTGYPSPAGVAVDRSSATLLTGMSNANRAKYQYAGLALENDIVWHNRSFYFAVTPQAVGAGGAIIPANTLCPSNSVADAYSHACTPLPAQTSIGQCVGAPAYWDLGTTDDASATPGTNALHAQLNPSYSVLTSTTGYGTAAVSHNTATDPGFVQAYCNGARANPAFIFEPGQPFLDPAAQNLTAGATLDEAGNFVDVRFGPLYLFDPTASSSTSPGTTIGDYHLAAAAGGAYNVGAAITAGPATLAHDIDGDGRPINRGSGSGVDIGADEFVPPGPQASVVVAASNLGNVQTGQSAATILTVTNTGTFGSSLVVSGATSSNAFYHASNNCPTGGLAVGASCQVTVTFGPTGPFATGTAEPTTITLAANDVNGTQTVALSGTAWPPIVTAAPVAVAFAPTESGVLATATVTLTNSGYGPDYFAGASVANTSGSGFSLGTGGTCVAYPTAVPVGGTCTLVVNFQPNGAGAFAGTLNLRGTANLGTSATVEQTITGAVTLTGNGYVPRFTITPRATSHGFGTVQVGSSAGPFTWTVTNTGTAPLQFAANSVVLTGATAGEFSLAGTTCVAPVAPGRTCTVDVTFAPTVTGFVSGTIVVTSGATQVASLTVSGTGANPPAINLGANFSFGTIATAATGVSHTFTLSNTGGLPLSISTLGVSAPSPAGPGVISFTVTGGTCRVGGTVAAGGSCSITVRFVDTSATTTAATLTVTGVGFGSTAPVYTATNSISGN